MRTRSDQGRTRNKRAAWPDNNNNKKAKAVQKKTTHKKKKEGRGVGNKESEWMRRKDIRKRIKSCEKRGRRCKFYHGFRSESRRRWW